MGDILNNQITDRDLYYYRRRLQNNVHHDILERFYELAKTEGFSKKKLAELISKDGSQVSNWLNRPSNLTLDTISDLLLAMGSELDTGVVPIMEKDRAA